MDSGPESGLYHPDLLALAGEHPRLIREPDAAYQIKAYNPLCGDKFELHFDKNGNITNVSFWGYGCVVSKASTALLCELLEGKSPEEAQEMMRTFLDRLKGEGKSELPDARIQLLLVARDYPARIQCAALAWEAALKDLLLLP